MLQYPTVQVLSNGLAVDNGMIQVRMEAQVAEIMLQTRFHFFRQEETGLHGPPTRPPSLVTFGSFEERNMELGILELDWPFYPSGIRAYAHTNTHALSSSHAFTPTHSISGLSLC